MSKGVEKGSPDLLSKCWDPSLSQEQFKLETSNFAYGLIIGGTNDKNEKLGQMGS